MKFEITATPDEVIKEVGARIVALRIARRLTQAELAARTGISKRTIERLEQGSGNLRLDAFVRICTALNLTDRFEMLLPRVELSPKDVFEGKALPKRVRKSAKPAIKWGDEE